MQLWKQVTVTSILLTTTWTKTLSEKYYSNGFNQEKLKGKSFSSLLRYCNYYLLLKVAGREVHRIWLFSVHLAANDWKSSRRRGKISEKISNCSPTGLYRPLSYSRTNRLNWKTWSRCFPPRRARICNDRHAHQLGGIVEGKISSIIVSLVTSVPENHKTVVF